MDVMHERVAGLDVHKETIVACVRIMAGGKATRECRTFDTTTAGLESLLSWLTESGCTQVAMEATGVYWKPVWNILSDGKFELLVANARHIKNVPGRKTDVNDAMWIADLVSFGLIKASFVPEPEMEELRSLLRTRKQLTREQTHPPAAEPHDFGDHRAELDIALLERLMNPLDMAGLLACQLLAGAHATSGAPLSLVPARSSP